MPPRWVGPPLLALQLCTHCCTYGGRLSCPAGRGICHRTLPFPPAALLLTSPDLRSAPSPPAVQLRYTWPESALKPGTQYRFHAYALNAQGRSAPSAPFPYTTLPPRVVSRPGLGLRWQPARRVVRTR